MRRPFPLRPAVRLFGSRVLTLRCPAQILWKLAPRHAGVPPPRLPRHARVETVRCARCLMRTDPGRSTLCCDVICFAVDTLDPVAHKHTYAGTCPLWTVPDTTFSWPPCSTARLSWTPRSFSLVRGAGRKTIAKRLDGGSKADAQATDPVLTGLFLPLPSTPSWQRVLPPAADVGAPCRH